MQYSSLGKITLLYTLWWTLGGAWLNWWWMSPRLHFADLHVSLICSDQDRLAEMVTPRYFTDLLGWTPWLDLEGERSLGSSDGKELGS